MGRNGTNKDLKKIEGTDRYEDRNCRRGRQAHQSLKAYWIMQYLISNATIEEPVHIGELINELEDRGILADKKSIYRDIREINIINYMVEYDADVYTAEEIIDDDTSGEFKLIAYSPQRKGYYIKNPNYDDVEIQLIVESLYASRFIEEGHTERLIDIVCSLLSDQKVRKIKHDVSMLDRKKTLNKNSLNHISVINEAMSSLNKSGSPCQIEYDEISYDVENGKLKKKHIHRFASPYLLAIFQGEYYLIYYMPSKNTLIEMSDSGIAKEETFPDGFIGKTRIDLMENVRCLYQQAREGYDLFQKADINRILEDERYTIRKSYYDNDRFSAFLPKKQKVVLEVLPRFISTIISLYGTKGAAFEKKDDTIIYTNNICIDRSFRVFLIENFPLVKWLNADKAFIGLIEEKIDIVKDTLSYYDGSGDKSSPLYKVKHTL